MEWAKPQYSKSKVSAAGAALITPFTTMPYGTALAIINNWRSSHSFPLNTFQNGLRRRGKEIYSSCLVAQRIKRLSSIGYKLYRFPTMTLSQMQDIGGCRAVLRNVSEVKRLCENYRESDIKHKLHTIDNYIDEPKESGYRGIHLIYLYYSDRNNIYNNLKIEMQIRSRFQHAWATAVETVGTFVQQALKSSQGEQDWLRFFSLMGTAVALREGTPPIPNTPTTKSALRRELIEQTEKLDVSDKLLGYGAALNVIQPDDIKENRFFLLELNPMERTVTVNGYKQRESKIAAVDYLETEQRIANIPGAEAVLVSVDSVNQLRRAYPNYFLDTGLFLRLLDEALKS